MTHAVIGYTGNVCSTPMVEYARSVPGVVVPVREEFDDYLMAKRFGDRIAPALIRNLHALYARRSTPYLDQPALMERRHGTPLPGPEAAPHILFKWRPFDIKTPQAADIRAVFHDNDVRPAVILRRSVTVQALKVYLSERLHGSRHMQFKAAKMPEADYAAFRERIAHQNLIVTVGEIDAVRDIARNFANRTDRLLEAMAFYFPGGSDAPMIVAEDIFDPMIDRERYAATLSCLLDAPLALPATEEAPGIRKAGVELTACRNATEVLADSRLAATEAQYQSALAGRTILSAP